VNDDHELEAALALQNPKVLEEWKRMAWGFAGKASSAGVADDPAAEQRCEFWALFAACCANALDAQRALERDASTTGVPLEPEVLVDDENEPPDGPAGNLGRS
jgi:hypothetical protein